MTSPRSTDAPVPTARALLRRRWLVIVLGLVAAGAIVGGAMGFSYLFLRPAAPAAVGLASGSPAAAPTAVPSADTAGASASTAASSAAAGDGTLEGTWSVDPTIGSFSDFSGSFVGYRVDEELANVGAATAVGRTPDVTGNLTLDGTTITAVEITADLSTLQSDKSQRDGQLRRQALETGTFPTATFVLTEPIDLGTVPVDGQVMLVTATGDLTIHGVTKSVAIPLEARLSAGVVTVTGSIDILFADYDIDRPVSFAVLTIADHGTMEFQLQLTRTS